jgi:hypothetical protein
MYMITTSSKGISAMKLAVLIRHSRVPLAYGRLTA